MRGQVQQRLALAKAAQQRVALPLPEAQPAAVTPAPAQALMPTATPTLPPAAAVPAVAVPAALAVPASRSATPPALYQSGQTRRVVTDLGILTSKERAILDATLVLCVAVDEARGVTGCSAKKACADLAQRLHDGRAFGELVAAAQVTYQRPRQSAADPLGVGLPRALQTRLERLYGFYMAGVAVGDPARYLVPARTPKGLEAMRTEDKHAFLAHYCKPTRPTVMQAWVASLAWYEAHGFERPAKDTFYRLEKEFPVAVKCRGRFTGSAWKALMPHRSRDVSMFKSNDIWVGDGHTFRARVQSPIHGKAFRPEITLVIDWRSRKIVGWSVDLAESTLAVSAAFRDAQLRTRARPLVYYRDNGSGQTGKLIDCEVHGTLARQGIASETGIPGNPQGRGVMERIWQTVIIPFASTYPTFMGNQADPETVRKAQIQVVKDQRAGKVSALLPSWRTFIADLAAHIEAYNTQHKHSALAGLTPEQAYQQYMDADSLVFAVDDAEIHALWLPEVARTPRRGLIELFGNKYFLPSLLESLPEGEQVRVRFDIHRAETVLVLAMDGQALGLATWEGNRSAAFPVPYIETKREERAKGIKARAAENIQRADDELMQTVEQDVQPRATWIELAPELPEVTPQEEAPRMSWLETLQALDALEAQQGREALG
ncbi:Mu transposase C-terminal domain-containing protein [Paucibacter sp. TC2R-5]|uniref:Mu transposase C-terminal domain-containing protein n=1 Tax=Paucibacter sp. TC2R-5 TaxID=2893555 RepID=UPI0021E4854F|nr:Mu transposase C-terminal domain-containing protein [Paucibacter sp. TC2R-5]MCV2359663.1 Mu transposase C-terminal domain-containing protein [Paucibacter sp. TC2R-5]